MKITQEKHKKLANGTMLLSALSIDTSSIPVLNKETAVTAPSFKMPIPMLSIFAIIILVALIIIISRISLVRELIKSIINKAKFNAKIKWISIIAIIIIVRISWFWYV